VPEPALAIDRSRMDGDLNEAAARLTERGFSVTTHLQDGEPVDVITRMVDSLHIDLVIVGHRRSKKFALRWWRGSVDSMLIERVRCSILVAGERPAGA
jgi:nucleotide-binding universal stress UspA family protein